ncbi:unnamed protein product [Chilo suppressalis]|uniref:BESS domain-containing protein n=1 Tax=Chilo suppressalis TaxID=168631 RepID=A0ABN8B3E2_CHISP|nr:unnamed protein product [Chilo suppressalis]
MVIYKDRQLSDRDTSCISTDKYRTMENHVEQDTCKYLTQQNETGGAEIKKNKINRKKCKNSLTVPVEDTETASSGIDKHDLDELKAVYMKCKAVMMRIESKYGHLLNISENDTKDSKEISEDTEDTSDKCECKTTKKIVFDEDGKIINTDISLDKHICPKKLKRKYSDAELTNNVQVEYEIPELISDNIGVLSNILQDPGLEITYRNKILHKIKLLKQECTNEMKFNKKSLINRVKTNPNEIFEFKGSNLNELPGYWY